jgi:hypothetical protein
MTSNNSGYGSRSFDICGNSATKAKDIEWMLLNNSSSDDD